jgi:hypothetical protein
MRLPYTEVELDAKGALVSPDESDAASELIAGRNATDVLVLCHGWNNTPGDARALYERLAASLDDVRDTVPGSRERRFVVVGLLWPSVQWSRDENSGAGAGAEAPEDLLRADIERVVQNARTRRRLLALVPRIDSDPAAATEFVSILRTTLPRSSKGEDAGAFRFLRSAPAEEVLDAARGDAVRADAPAFVGGAADVPAAGLAPLGGPGGSGSGVGLFDSLVGALRNVVNVASYYTMKERAGVVGGKGVSKLLDRLHSDHPHVRLHLIGHSFGGRALTAAAKATTAPLSSLALLQAAFSHFGISHDWDGGGTDGLFVAVPAKVSGPIIVTFTKNDTSVGIAYAVASRLARQVGAGIGDASDPYGGIGRNGALKTPAALPNSALVAVGGRYAFERGKVSSLNADAFISGHSDVTGHQVAYAILCAVETA